MSANTSKPSKVQPRFEATSAFHCVPRARDTTAQRAARRIRSCFPPWRRCGCSCRQLIDEKFMPRSRGLGRRFFAAAWRHIFLLPLTSREPCFGTRALWQGDKDMAEQNEAKTKTIGYLPIEKVQTLKGWDEYVDKSAKLSVLRAEAQQAKNCVRDALKERLNEQGDIDFVGEGDRVRVFRVFRRPQSRR